MSVPVRTLLAEGPSAEDPRGVAEIAIAELERHRNRAG